MPETVSPRLGPLRRARGLSQADLALAAGISRQAIGAIEAGRTQPSVATALRLARSLGRSVEDLFTAEAEPHIDAELAAPPAGSRRVAAAVIDGRLVARPLGLEAPLTEPAAALIASASRGVARVEPLVDRATLESTVFLTGSDPALGILASHLTAAGKRTVWFWAGNREAVYDLSDRRTHIAATNGSDAEIRRLTRRIPAELRHFEFLTGEQGWIVAAGNPEGLQGARDLARPGIRLANRPPGTGARALLDAELRKAGVQQARVTGYASALPMNSDVARAIAYGFADIAVAAASVAAAFRLDFIPLRSERWVLSMRAADLNHPGVAALLGMLGSPAYRRDVEAFAGYDLSRLGQPLSL